MHSYKIQKLYRKNNHDYSSNGYYFITICTSQKIRYFCEIKNNRVLYNKIGLRAKVELFDLINKYNGFRIDKYVIMPDHVHLLINILSDNYVGEYNAGITSHRRITPRRDPTIRDISGLNSLQKNSIQSFVNHYKGRITKWCKTNNLEFAWQRRFHDRIIRTEKELYNVRNYIDNNITMWNVITH
jgi:putative transposase